MRIILGSKTNLKTLKNTIMENQVGLFIAAYRITTGMAGAQTLELHLAVSAPDKKVSGTGVISQAVNPPLHEVIVVNGVYSVMTVMPNNTHIQVRLEGSNGVSIIMVLEKDWASGKANYSFVNPSGQTVELKDIPVVKI